MLSILVEPIMELASTDIEDQLYIILKSTHRMHFPLRFLAYHGFIRTRRHHRARTVCIPEVPSHMVLGRLQNS